MTTKLMLDSGAYSAYTQKTKIDLGEYIDYIHRNEDVYELYFNLDVLSDGGKSYMNWIHMRANGLDPVPVFHIGTDERYLKKYLSLTDYVAIGAIANLSTSERLKSLDNIWKDYLTDKAGMPTVKVHGFGLTSLRVIKGYPWYSLDSTSWVMFGRYGAILVPKSKNNGNGYNYDENPFIVTVSSKSPKQSVADAHFNTLNKNVQDVILKYIEDMGFEMGLEQEEEDGAIIATSIVRTGLSNTHYLRDQINMLYYIGVQNSMPEWPWAWVPRRPRRVIL